MTVFDEDVLDGELALVTGATGGIGAETSRVLAGMGASLLVTGRDERALRELWTELEDIDGGGSVESCRADITEASDRAALIETARDLDEPLSVLVNSAGVGDHRQAFEDLDHDRLEEVTEVNYTATAKLTQRAYRRMKACGDGSIVNVSSLSGLRGTYRHVPYSGSKFALTGFTHSLAVEAIEHGIRVNAVCPGWVDTEMGRQGIRDKAEINGVSYERQRETEESKIPSGRITDPREVGRTIGFLVTDAAPNIVGESIKISGGVVLR